MGGGDAGRDAGLDAGRDAGTPDAGPTPKEPVNMEAVIARYRPHIYFCGHMHRSLLAWHNDT